MAMPLETMSFFARGPFPQVLFLLLLLPAPYYAASYNAYQYDMAVPQFTPDGRLLQTEYAQAAADHSRPVVVFPLSNDDDDQAVLVATCRSAGTRQERLICWNDNSVVAMAGVLADSLALLQKVREEDLTSRRWYGEALSAERLAREIASLCHQHAFGGGIRPFGSTLLIVSSGTATTTSASSGTLSGLRTWRTDPSGSIAERKVDRPIVMGGGDKGTALQRKLDGLFDTLDDADSPSTRITKVLSLLRDSEDDSTSNKSYKSTREPVIEAALISKGRGVFKLSDEMIAARFFPKST